MTIALATCDHDTSRAFRATPDAIADAWECDECGHLTPFVDLDYAFVNTRAWRPAAPAGVSPLAWMFMGREARLATFAAVASLNA